MRRKETMRVIVHDDAAAKRLRAAGFVPWTLAGAPEDAWTLTDWFENLYLRSAGPARYDALAGHRLSWTHPSVVAALERMRRILAPAFTTAPRVFSRTTFPASVAQLFALHPRVAMLLEGDFVPGVAGPAPAQLGVDVDVFVFPGPGPGATERYVVGGGDVATLMRPPSRAAVELMRFLASPRAAEVWARRGGFVSPNEQVALDAYPDGVTRTIARSLLDAGDGFHFDLSDLQPVAFGGTTGAGMWSLLRDFIAGKSDARQTATQLEAAADAAYRP